MKRDFDVLANSIKSKLVERLGSEAEDSYIYKELIRVTLEWKTGKRTLKKTDIGAAAVKTSDSGSVEDDELASEICTLADLYNRNLKY